MYMYIFIYEGNSGLRGVRAAGRAVSRTPGYVFVQGPQWQAN